MYSKPSLIWLQLIRVSDNLDQIMKNAVHSCVHTLKDTWHLGRHMSHCVFRQNLTLSSNQHYYVQKQVQLLTRLPINKYILFLLF
jgi:hypothetical protein